MKIKKIPEQINDKRRKERAWGEMRIKENKTEKVGRKGG